MAMYSTAFGMDVHLRSTTVCAISAGTGETEVRRFPGNPWADIASWMAGFEGPSLAAYESGYCGFEPQRALSALGVECAVAAVSRLPKAPGDSRAKNDRNDARRIASAVLSHDVVPVWVPPAEVEGLRDLAHALDDATGRAAEAKQRLLAHLARRGHVFDGRTAAGNPRKYWTYDFWRWLDAVELEDAGGAASLRFERDEVERLSERRDELLAECRKAVGGSRLAGTVEALQAIKGCGFVLAMAFAAEVGDFERFSGGRRVTSYFGLAPREHSSGDSRRLGGVSQAGNSLVRRLAVEGAWAYACAGRAPKIMPKGTGVPLEVRMHARKGSARILERRAAHLEEGMPAAKANAATAAELVRWLWALGLMQQRIERDAGRRAEG